ncbi:hypothetical protein [Novipirellula rosea]
MPAHDARDGNKKTTAETVVVIDSGYPADLMPAELISEPVT